MIYYILIKKSVLGDCRVSTHAHRPIVVDIHCLSKRLGAIVKTQADNSHEKAREGGSKNKAIQKRKRDDEGQNRPLSIPISSTTRLP